MDPQVRGYCPSLRFACMRPRPPKSQLHYFGGSLLQREINGAHMVMLSKSQIQFPAYVSLPAVRGLREPSPPSDGFNLWTDAATKQRRHWRSRGLEIFPRFATSCSIVSNVLQRKKQYQIDNDRTCRKLG